MSKKQLKPEQPEINKWLKAQEVERTMHTMEYAEGLVHYATVYNHYFEYLALGKDLYKLIVIEVGPADFPALAYCHNFTDGWVVEPMPSEILSQITEEKQLKLIADAFEEESDAINWLFKTVEETKLQTHHKVEIWFFNVLQHVLRPHAVVEKAKVIADRIRYFEPINEPITEYHLNKFSLNDFNAWFGNERDTVNFYKGGSKPDFHTADCAYGIWHK